MQQSPIPFRTALGVWWRIGLLGFGGPAGQIALMHRIIVEERGWLDEQRFLQALNWCMLLPGPEAQQLATYMGWQMHGVHGRLGAGLATGAFLGLFLFAVPFPVVVLIAGLTGWALTDTGRSAPMADPMRQGDPIDMHPRITAARAAALCATLWLGTIATLLALPGVPPVYGDIAMFFSKVAVVTFGGAYAVLGYVTQQGVEHYAWLASAEMLDGLGLAETTPGPLILVTQFVGILAASHDAAPGTALLAGSAGALLTTWVTFLPCFLWIFASAPYVDRLSREPRLAAALAGITAAVVGVIANLALWFAINFLFTEQLRADLPGFSLVLPVPTSLDLPAAALSLGALAMVFAARLGVPAVLASCTMLGIAWQWLVPGPRLQVLRNR